MTPEQRRQMLAEAGYRVARRPFRDGLGGKIYHMFRRLPGDVYDREAAKSRHYSIDLETGRWNHWGVDADGVWHDLRQLDGFGVKNFTNATATCSSLAPMMGASEATFVGECVKRGFVLTDQVARTIDFGNRFALYQGRRYLICERARKILDMSFNSLTLDEFLAGGTSPPPASKDVPPRPIVSMKDRPLVMNGNTVQQSLF